MQACRLITFVFVIAGHSLAAEPAMTRGDHWSFQPVKRPALPTGGVNPAARQDGARQDIRNPIDTFIRARLEKERLAPSPPADRATLMRRLKFDLLGLRRGR